MTPRFHHVALIGNTADGARHHGLPLARHHAKHCPVSGAPRLPGITGGRNRQQHRPSHYDTIDADAIGLQCDLGLVVGGDGTMLGIGRRLARYGTPLIGINQGRLGFITDIALADYPAILPAMLQGEYEEDQRPLMHASVMRDGECVFEALAMNDVVVARGATAAMVELRVEVDGHFVATQRADGMIISRPPAPRPTPCLPGGRCCTRWWAAGWWCRLVPHTLSNRPIVLPDSTEIAIELVGGRDISANFDMQSLTSLLHGDRILVRRLSTACAFCTPGAGITCQHCAKNCAGTTEAPEHGAAAHGAARFSSSCSSLTSTCTQAFTALTGETGAGNRILIDALQLALGARADASVVREGARQADISAEFDLPEELADWLEHGGFEGGTSLLLRRVIDPQGKSRA